MNHAPPLPASAPEPDDLGWDLAVLRDLAELGMGLAQTFARRTQEAVEEAGLDPNASADPGQPFARMARCVRQTLALRAKFLKDQRTPAGTDIPDRAHRAARAQHRKRKALIRGALTDFIESTARDRGDEERLLSDMDERLDDAEAEEDFDSRPIGQVVIEICETLGVTPDMSFFDDEDLGIGEYAQPPPPAAPGHRQPGPRGGGIIHPGERDPRDDDFQEVDLQEADIQEAALQDDDPQEAADQDGDPQEAAPQDDDSQEADLLDDDPQEVALLDDDPQEAALLDDDPQEIALLDEIPRRPLSRTTIRGEDDLQDDDSRDDDSISRRWEVLPYPD